MGDYSWITENHLSMAIKKLSAEYTAGLDTAPFSLIKTMSRVLITPFTIIFNFALKSKFFSNVRKATIVCPILKGVNGSYVKNYIPILLLMTFLKKFILHL